MVEGCIMKFKRVRKFVNKKRLLLVFVAIVAGQFMIIKSDYFDKNIDRDKPYEEIEATLMDDSIENGVVVDDKKDIRDINKSTFEYNTKKEKKEAKKKKDPYYTLGDIGKAPRRLDKIIAIRPPKGKNVDNINRRPDPNKNNDKNKPFARYVIFYPQHQDDEVLWAGSAIRDAIRKRGRNNVFVALVSSGTGHKIFSEKQFDGLDIKEKAEYRNREFLDSCKNLGIPRKNIFFIYKERGDWKTDFKLEREFALKMEKKYKSVTHITHSYKYDDHFMHRANGQTLYDLWTKDKIKDLRFYLKPFLVEYVDASNNTLNVYTVNNQEDYNRIKNACRSYKYVDPRKKRAGIGYRTDYLSFDSLVYDPNQKSYIIIQNNKKKG